MTAPAIDTGSFGSGGGSTTAHATITGVTMGANEVAILVVVLASQNNGSVSSVTGGTFAGTWQKRASLTDTTIQSGYTTDCEIWWNYTGASGFSGGTITINFSTSLSGSNEQHINMLFGVTGAGTPSSPFDTHAGLPILAVHNTSSVGDTISTSNGNDLIIQNIYSVNGNPSANMTKFGGPGNIIGNTYMWVYDQAVSSTLSSNTIAELSSALSGWINYVDAIAGVAPAVSGTWASTDTKDTFSVHANLYPTGHWASTEAKDTFSTRGGLIGGTWASTETKDTFHVIGNPVTGIWGSTETPDTFYAKAYEVDGVIIQSMFFPLSMTMTVTEIIPTRITTNLPLFSQVMEVEEVPATYFVTAAVTTTLKGFGQEATVHITLPDAVSVAEMNPPGRGGGGALPTISTERELLDLFGGHAFNRGVDAVVPSTRVAASNLTTAFSPKSIVRAPMPPPPRRRK